jgi:hypothetical protein
MRHFEDDFHSYYPNKIKFAATQINNTITKINFRYY